MPSMKELGLLRQFYLELKKLKITPEERKTTMLNIKKYVNITHPRIGYDINMIIDEIILEDRTIALDPNGA